MITYVLNFILFSALFWLVYIVWLKKETFFTANRIYLLAAPALAILLPVVSFESLNFFSESASLMQSPEVFVNEITQVNTVAEANASNQGSASLFSLSNILMCIYGIGVLISLALFLFKLRKLLNLKSLSENKIIGDQKVSVLRDSSAAFTFFGCIFLGDNFSQAERNQILKHELAHVNQKHSYDLLYFEVLRIFFWFNPFIYLFQKNAGAVHEFLADRKVSETTDTKAYSQSLLNAGFGTKQLSFTNSFFTEHSLKTRLIMLHKSKSSRLSKLKYLALIPLIFSIAVYTSCAEDNTSKEPSSDQAVPTPPAPPPPPAPSDFQKDQVPFSRLDETAEFREGSEYKVEGDPEKAFNTGMKQFIMDNFDTDKAASASKTDSQRIGNQSVKEAIRGTQRIDAQFIIDKNGNISEVKVRAPHETLKEEAKRVINSLPQLKPGKKDGKVVSVTYTIPIRLHIRE